METKQIEQLIVAALEDIKGKDIEVIDTSKLTPLFESIVIACGNLFPYRWIISIALFLATVSSGACQISLSSFAKMSFACRVTCAKMFLMKCTLHLCQEVPGKLSLMAAVSPACASDTTSSGLRIPLVLRLLNSSL